jgi:parallel beta-helix repeat protein
MKRHTLWRSLLWTLVAGCFLALSAAGQQIDVPATGNYPDDHNNVQTALSTVGVQTVVLHGDFNFGVDGGVAALQPNVALVGGTDGATITGMGKLFPGVTFPHLINVAAIGCRIADLSIKCTRTDGWSGGVVVRTMSTDPSDNPVIIENNTIAVYPPVPDAPQTITGRAYALRILDTGCPIKVLGNTLSGNYGVYAIPNSGDVIISGNTITSRNYGMYVMQNTRDCFVTDNTVYGNSTSNAIHVCTTPGYGKVLISRNRTYGAAYSIRVHHLGLADQTVPAEITDNYLEPRFAFPSNIPVGTFAFGVWGDFNKSPLNVVNNVVRVIADQPGDNPTASQAGIYLYSWDPRDGLDQENGPVLVEGNDIEIRYPMPDVPDYSIQTLGILLGDGGVGLNNVTVEGNRLSGSVMDGIARLWYGKNTVIAGNDLSGLKTWEAQLWLVAGHTVVTNNKLGFANHIPGFSWGVLLGSALMPPEYQPLPPAIPYPDPYPTENCVLYDNDYRGTGLPGWDNGSGCIILQSFADVGGFGTEVRNNLVKETGRFPQGTGGASKQVFENKTTSGLVHDNRIVGLPANFVANPGIGQRLKAARGVGMSNLLTSLEKGPGKDGTMCAVEEGMPEQAGAKSLIPTPEQPVDVATVPSRPELMGNYPNPFNPSTTIRYGLPLRSEVTLTVFNTLGEQVGQLVNGDMEAGYHEVQFDGSALPSGVYFYRIQAGSFVSTKRMLILK